MLLPASKHVDASAFASPAALFLWGPGSWSDLHRHHCVQVVMALRGTLRFRQRQRQRWTTCGAVLVRPDAWHEVNARGTDVLIAFVDAESELGVALAERTASEVAPIPPATVAEWRAQLGDPSSLTAARVEPWVTRTLLCDRRPSCTCSRGRSASPYVRTSSGCACSVVRVSWRWASLSRPRLTPPAFRMRPTSRGLFDE